MLSTVTIKDNVYVKKDNILYTSRLDKKIDLNIPQSITYNNTEFIEISSDDTDSFFVTLFLLSRNKKS